MTVYTAHHFIDNMNSLVRIGECTRSAKEWTELSTALSKANAEHDAAILQAAEMYRAMRQERDVLAANIAEEKSARAAISTQAWKDAMASYRKELEGLRAYAVELEEVLRDMLVEKCDYMTRNKLGDPEREHNIEWARAVLARKPQCGHEICESKTTPARGSLPTLEGSSPSEGAGSLTPRAALRELLEAVEAAYPAAGRGRAAQDAWSERRQRAKEAALAVLAECEFQVGLPQSDDGLDELLATVAGVPCRFCMGPGSDSGPCPECGKPTQDMTSADVLLGVEQLIENAPTLKEAGIVGQWVVDAVEILRAVRTLHAIGPHTSKWTFTISTPERRCLELLARGEITASKAAEWMRAYLNEGRVDPLPEGQTA